MTSSTPKDSPGLYSINKNLPECNSSSSHISLSFNKYTPRGSFSICISNVKCEFKLIPLSFTNSPSSQSLKLKERLLS